MTIICNLARDLNIISNPLEIESKKQIEDVARKVVFSLAKDHQVTCLNFVVTNQVDRGGIFEIIVSAEHYTIYLPPIYTINRSKIPFLGPDDPNLKNDEKVQRFADDVARWYNLEKRQIATIDKVNLTLFLEMIKDQEMAKKSLKFILLHELGHIKHLHMLKSTGLDDKLEQPHFKIINFITLGIFKQVKKLQQSRQHEREADEFAFKVSEEIAQGGIHLFSLVNGFKFKPLRQKLFHQCMKILIGLTHTSFSKRAQRIENYLKTGKNSIKITTLQTIKIENQK